jgi:predicted nucleic acid-binding protein
VKNYVAERHSHEIAELLQQSPVAISRITPVEVSSALCRRCRQGDLSATQRDDILEALQQDLAAFYLIELTADVVSYATRLLRRHPLRSADAVQLASCLTVARRLSRDPKLVAFDERLVAAAREEGLPVHALSHVEAGGSK